MHLIATGTFTDPAKLAPLLPEEDRMIYDLHDAGFILCAYRRTDRSGVVLVLNATDPEDANDRLGKLPLARAGLIDFELAQIGPF